MKVIRQMVAVLLTVLCVLSGCAKKDAQTHTEKNNENVAVGKTGSFEEYFLSQRSNDALLFVVGDPTEQELKIANAQALLADWDGESQLLIPTKPGSKLTVQRLAWVNGLATVKEILYQNPSTEKDFALQLTARREDSYPTVRVTVENGDKITEYLLKSKKSGRLEEIGMSSLGERVPFSASETDDIWKLDEAGLKALLGERSSVVERSNQSAEWYYPNGMALVSGGKVYYLELITQGAKGLRGIQVGDDVSKVLSAFYGVEGPQKALSGTTDVQYSMLYGDSLGDARYGEARYTGGARSAVMYEDKGIVVYFSIVDGAVAAIRYSKPI